MAVATIVLVTPIRTKPGKKTHIKIIAPAGYDFDPTANKTVTVEDTDHTLSWTSRQLKSSNTKWLKYSIKANPNGYVDWDLPDAGTITVTLPNPPANVAPVATLEVDYVDEIDAP
jgi:hypothetical protein